MDKSADRKQSYNEEIDLFELLNGLVDEKKTVFYTFFGVIFIATFYLIFGTKTYETKVSILPPYEKDVRSADFDGLVSFHSKELYSAFLANLKSPDVISRLLDQPEVQKLMPSSQQHREHVIDSLQKSIKVVLPIKSKTEYLVSKPIMSQLIVSANDPDVSYMVLMRLLTLASQSTKGQILNNQLGLLKEKKESLEREFDLENRRLNKEKNAQIVRLLEADKVKASKIKQQIVLIKQKYKENKSYQLVRLQSNFELAKRLGIRTPVRPEDYKKLVNGKSSTSIEVVRSSSLSDYWLGTEILHAEIQKLKNQKNNDAFVQGLADLQEKLDALKVNHKVEMLRERKDNVPYSELLRKLQYRVDLFSRAIDKLSSAQFDVYRLLHQPIKPIDATKPKKGLILTIASVLGLLLGVVVALVRRAYLNRK